MHQGWHSCRLCTNQVIAHLRLGHQFEMRSSGDEKRAIDVLQRLASHAKHMRHQLLGSVKTGAR